MQYKNFPILHSLFPINLPNIQCEMNGNKNISIVYYLNLKYNSETKKIEPIK